MTEAGPRYERGGRLNIGHLGYLVGETANPLSCQVSMRGIGGHPDALPEAVNRRADNGRRRQPLAVITALQL